MSGIKATPHVHEWSQHLYNPWGRYWFQYCVGKITVRIKDKIERVVPCERVERWTTIIDRRSEIPEVMSEREEMEIRRRAEDAR